MAGYVHLIIIRRLLTDRPHLTIRINDGADVLYFPKPPHQSGHYSLYSFSDLTSSRLVLRSRQLPNHDKYLALHLDIGTGYYSCQWEYIVGLQD